MSDWSKGRVKRNERLKLHRHESVLLWFTGLPGAGKTTLAYALDRYLYSRGFHTYALDDDNIGYGLCGNLGLSREDHKESARRVAEAGRLFVDAGIITIAAFTSPYLEDRKFARKLFRPGEFVEIYVKCPVAECEKRDGKGYYEKARSGRIKGFTGVDSIYEEPENPELILETDKYDVPTCLEKILAYLEKELII
ncbi:MAG: adenylyl-sulfate kinase [Thermodesulfobacteriota bacterium]|nr:adenylyl-sulfate kinase [Thermodesulfobacteriota bacterium]